MTTSPHPSLQRRGNRGNCQRMTCSSLCWRGWYRERGVWEDRSHCSHVVVVTRETCVSRSFRRMTRCTHGFPHRLKIACKGQRVGILEGFHDLGFRIERMARETALVVQHAEMDRMGEACHLPFMRNRTRWSTNESVSVDRLVYRHCDTSYTARGLWGSISG